MSTISNSPRIKEIADIIGDVAPHSMSEFYGINFSSGSAPTSGPLSLSQFRNKTINNTQTELQRIIASSRNYTDYFGYSVDISGDGNTAVVGAYNSSIGAQNYCGSAYIFEKVNGTWSQVAQITASDYSGGDNFGWSVSVAYSGNYVIIGAYRDDDNNANDSGSAYIYQKPWPSWTTTSTHMAKLTASDGALNDNFGRSVAISGDGFTAVVGAPYDDDTYTDEGSVYIFKLAGTSWSQVAKLTASDGLGSDYFGWSVSASMNGNTIIVGAYGDDNTYTDQGSVYIFEKGVSTWTQVAKLTASDGAAGDYFGYSVSVSSNGDVALVGAYGDNDTYTDEGSAYIFQKVNGTWTQVAKLTASDGAADDYFGYSVAISGDGSKAIVGVYGDDDNGTLSGSAYIFEKPGSGWSNMSETYKIAASDGAANDYFGYSVSISEDGSDAIVGAYKDDNSLATDSGSAYMYEIT